MKHLAALFVFVIFSGLSCAPTRSDGVTVSAAGDEIGMVPPTVEKPSPELVARMIDADGKMLDLLQRIDYAPRKLGEAPNYYEFVRNDRTCRQLAEVFDHGTVELTDVGNRAVIRGKVGGYLLQRGRFDEYPILVGTEAVPLYEMRCYARTLLLSKDRQDVFRGISLAQFLMDTGSVRLIKPYLGCDNWSLRRISGMLVVTWLRRSETPDELESDAEWLRKTDGGFSEFAGMIAYRQEELRKMNEILAKLADEAGASGLPPKSKPTVPEKSKSE